MDELWERLGKKMNAARNAMCCDCGDTHARIPVESIRASEARYCKKCKLRHPAKHVWFPYLFITISNGQLMDKSKQIVLIVSILTFLSITHDYAWNAFAKKERKKIIAFCMT